MSYTNKPGWEGVAEAFRQVLLDAGVELAADIGSFPAEYPLPAAQVADLKGVTITEGGAKPSWLVSTGNQVNVAAARTTHFDIFNAAGSGKLLKVLGIYIIPTLAAVGGVGLTWEIIRTSAVGSGGVGCTPVPCDSDNTALPAQITARGKPAGGATTSITVLSVNTSSEETVPYASQASQFNHIPAGRVLVLHEGQGLKLDQTTSSNVGSTNVVVVFTVQ